MPSVCPDADRTQADFDHVFADLCTRRACKRKAAEARPSEEEAEQEEGCDEDVPAPALSRAEDNTSIANNMALTGRPDSNNTLLLI